MGAVLKIDWVSPSDYLAYEESIEGKAEYYNGVIVDMAGGSENHSLITMNVGGLLFGALRGKPCRAYDSNFKVEISKDSVYGYPDVLVICGDTQRSPLHKDICTNPSIVIEVLSDSTRHRDLGLKLMYYRQIASLQEVIVIEQEYPLVTVHFRNAEGHWDLAIYPRMEDTVQVPSLSIGIAMTDIYANATLTIPLKSGRIDD